MSGTPERGRTDGEVTQFSGRSWRWNEELGGGIWLPSDPEPYETITGSSGAVVMFHPVLAEWLDPSRFPNPDGIVPTDTVAAEVREADESADQ
jgi:hypothetical protein